MIEFLQTDIAGTPTYSMNPNILGQIEQFLVKFLDPDLDKRYLSSIWDQHLENKETNEKIWNKLAKIATSATSIPFSIFTTMMSQYSGKLKFLESTIELLQQFTLEMIESSDQFLIFPGDGCKFKLKCTRCGKYVTYPESIGRILSIAPYAMLSHLDITLSYENANDISDNLEVLPILFTSHKNYERVKASFVESSKNGKKVTSSCHVKKNRSGEFLFCEAVKVDDSLSDDELKKNFQNTISLLTVLFEDASEGLKWYDKISKHLCESDEQPWDMLSLFNSTDESDASEKFGVGQDYFNELPGWKQDQVKLLRSWCLFADREWFRNLLVIVGEVSERIYGSKTDIPKHFLNKFYLDDEKVHAHMKR